MLIRTGFGFDSHLFVKGRPLYLGGIKIKSKIGLKGTSDADVVIHSLCDAILGALSEKDIGEHFPDTDNINNKRRSTDFLVFTKDILLVRGYKVNNIDITVILEKPNLSPYKSLIKNNIAEILGIPKEIVSVKAKHPEGAFSKKAAVCYALATLFSE